VNTRFFHIALAFLAVTFFLAAINGAYNAGTSVGSSRQGIGELRHNHMKQQ